MGIELRASGFYEWGEKPKAMLGVDTARLDECIEYPAEQQRLDV